MRHSAARLRINAARYQLVPFEKAWFDEQDSLDNWVKSCDAIVHLAGMNRHPDAQVIYQTNIELAEKLVAALKRTGAKPHILFSSSTQEAQDNLYGQSKLIARTLLQSWAQGYGALFTGLLIPNVFGPFGKPFYNSGIATFCYQLTHGQEPQILKDASLKLIYVDDLVSEILSCIDTEKGPTVYTVPHGYEAKVSDVLTILLEFKENYLLKGEIPNLQDPFRLRLFNTFRSYIDLDDYFPRHYTQHTDNRGCFVELIRLHDHGQVSFSTTHPNITRGNHFHTRKVERFAVIQGKARISMRKFGTSAIHHFDIDATLQPAYVDMPVWYTHNITNTGTESLVTVFWINEFFNPSDADTYLETV
jgi:UDP-2-acetamido-2,6-beta-L-arabino-hexul-4-ose reductase